ncbi:hypothetical protein TNCV_3091581 [Trichonephila clavipes]|nr:hypothetical protein TNCV_3091581 [Trichonephila clavipes]
MCSLLLGSLNHIVWEIVRHITAKRLPTPLLYIKKRTVYILVLALNLGAAVAQWSRYRIMAGLVTSSSPVPLKTRRRGTKHVSKMSKNDLYQISQEISFQWNFLTLSHVNWADIQNYVEFLSKEMPDTKINDNCLFEVERNSNKLEQLENQHAEQLVKDG